MNFPILTLDDLTELTPADPADVCWIRLNIARQKREQNALDAHREAVAAANTHARRKTDGDK